MLYAGSANTQFWTGLLSARLKVSYRNYHSWINKCIMTDKAPIIKWLRFQYRQRTTQTFQQYFWARSVVDKLTAIDFQLFLDCQGDNAWSAALWRVATWRDGYKRNAKARLYARTKLNWGERDWHGYPCNYRIFAFHWKRYVELEHHFSFNCFKYNWNLKWSGVKLFIFIEIYNFILDFEQLSV